VTDEECVVFAVVEKEVIEPYAVAADVLYLHVAVSFVESEMLVPVVPNTRVPDGTPAERTGAVLSTVTLKDEAVAVFPAASRTTALKVYAPSETVVLSQAMP
jgi:hypothetical protein